MAKTAVKSIINSKQKLGDYIEEVAERNNALINAPVLSVTNSQGFVSSEKYFDKKVYSKDLSNYKIIRKGQFAYNPSRVNVGSIARLREFDKGFLSPMYVIFKTKDGLDADFLDYWISSKRFNNLVKAGTQGTVRDSLNYSALAEFPLHIPPIDKQKEIVKIIASIDRVINSTQAVIDQTQNLKKALMQELFTRGIPGRHRRFKKTKMGMIPEEWEICEINDIGKIVTGGTPSTKVLSYYNGDKLWATPGDLGEYKYIVSTSKMLSRKGMEVLRLIPKDSILVVCIGSTIGKVGMAAVEMATNQQINSIICSDDWNSHFVYYWMTKNSSVLKYFSGKHAVPIISKSTLSTLSICKPQKEEQIIIGSFLNNVDTFIGEQNKSLTYITDFKSALMQNLLKQNII